MEILGLLLFGFGILIAAAPFLAIATLINQRRLREQFAVLRKDVEALQKTAPQAAEPVRTASKADPAAPRPPPAPTDTLVKAAPPPVTNPATPLAPAQPPATPATDSLEPTAKDLPDTRAKDSAAQAPSRPPEKVLTTPSEIPPAPSKTITPLAPQKNHTQGHSLSTNPAPLVSNSSSESKATTPNWEWLIGTRALTAAGVLTLFLSFAFFLRYAIGQGWIGPEMRVTGVAIAGAAMLLGGWACLRRSMQVLGQGLIGGGFATWYLTVCAAYNPRLLLVDLPLISPLPAFGLLIVVIGLAHAAALRYQSQIISVAALIGGLAAPVLTEIHAQHLLFGYVALLVAGVVGSALKHHWRILDTVASAGTVALFMWWFEGFRSPATDSVWPTVGWLITFHMLLGALAIAPTLLKRAQLTGERLLIALGNIVFTFAYAALLLGENHSGALALWFLTAASAYAGIGRWLAVRNVSDQRVDHGCFAVSVTLSTLGLLYLLPVNAVASGWVVEAVLLFALSKHFGKLRARFAGMGLWTLAALRTFYELPGVPHDAPLLWHPAIIHLGLLVTSAALIATLERKSSVNDNSIANRIAVAMAILAAIGAGLIGWWDYDRIDHTLSGDGLWGLSQWRLPLAACFPFAIGAVATLIQRRHQWDILRGIGTLSGCLTMLIAGTGILVQEPVIPVINPRFVVASLGAALVIINVHQWYGERLMRLILLTLACYAGVEAAGWLSPDHVTALSYLAFAGGPIVYASAITGFGWLMRKRRRPQESVITLAAWSIASISLTLSYMTGWGDGVVPVLPLLNGSFIIACLTAIGTAFSARGLSRHWQSAPLAGLSTCAGIELMLWFREDSLTLVKPAWLALGLLTFVLGKIIHSWLAAPPAKKDHTVTHPLSMQLAVTAWAVAAGALIMDYMWHPAVTIPLLSVRGLACILGLGLATLGGLLIRRDDQQSGHLSTIGGVVCGGLVLVNSIEWPVWVWHQTESIGSARLVLSIVWLACAGLMLTAGFAKRIRSLRLCALALLALCCGKLLFVDLADSSTLVRIASFCITGLVMIGASWLYHRLEKFLKNDIR